MNKSEQELFERVCELEQENLKLRSRLYDNEVENARERLDEATRYAHEDMTGQDGEEATWNAAHDLCRAQDRQLEHDNPDRYSEMRAMGLLR